MHIISEMFITIYVIRASLSKPHINSTAVRETYYGMYICTVRPDRILCCSCACACAGYALIFANIAIFPACCMQKCEQITQRGFNPRPRLIIVSQ